MVKLQKKFFFIENFLKVNPFYLELSDQIHTPRRQHIFLSCVADITHA